jgi:hypothetical protein
LHEPQLSGSCCLCTNPMTFAHTDRVGLFGKKYSFEPQSTALVLLCAFCPSFPTLRASPTFWLSSLPEISILKLYKHRHTANHLTPSGFLVLPDSYGSPPLLYDPDSLPGNLECVWPTVQKYAMRQYCYGYLRRPTYVPIREPECNHVLNERRPSVPNDYSDAPVSVLTDI